jgi:hypothetical protein
MSKVKAVVKLLFVILLMMEEFLLWKSEENVRHNKFYKNHVLFKNKYEIFVVKEVQQNSCKLFLDFYWDAKHLK